MTDSMTREVSAWVKLDLLAHGIDIAPSVAALAPATTKFAARKNVYNSPLWQSDGQRIPQELRVLGLIVGLNSHGPSPWRLLRRTAGEGLSLEHSPSGTSVPVDLISDLNALGDNSPAARVANLYGGAALAFFSPRSCYFFPDGTQCGFCSLAGTAAEVPQFSAILSVADVRTALRETLASDPGRIEQVMIVGGNMRDLDRGFRHHIELGAAASGVLSEAGVSESVSIHIATMPPRDLSLLGELKGLGNVHVMFNVEIWDSARFSVICPGKDRDYGRQSMLSALERLRDTVGPYRAHSLLVTGLEPPASTLAGARALSTMGISPIINIYHSDRHSRLGLGTRPQFRDLAQVAHGLQSLYEEFPLQPYWRSCGRNAIDVEAQRGMFRAGLPDFLAGDGA